MHFAPESSYFLAQKWQRKRFSSNVGLAGKV
jgi:hypothetical protein